MTRTLLMSLLAMLASSTLYAQSPNPTVHMNVTLPDGQVVQASAPESGLASVAVKDGNIDIRPTILDDKWTRVVLTFFRPPSASSAGEELAAVEAKTGGSAVQPKISPALKVAVSSVTPPTQAAAATNTH